MKAVAVLPGQAGSAHLREVPRPLPRAGEILVRVLEVGIDGTDIEIDQGLYGQAPPGDAYLILGHESLGVVERVGPRVTGFRPGEQVVATVRRPCPERCLSCAAGESDMCLTGNYTERGIKGRHGFMAEAYSERPEYLVKIPASLRPFAVLLEPLSIAEKGVAQAFVIQHRLRWRPRTALVLGAGPLGLLATLVLRTLGLRTYTLALGQCPSPRTAMVEALGGSYLPAEVHPLSTLPEQVGALDLIFEATGSSRVAFEAIQALGTNGVLCLTGVTGGHRTLEVPSDQIALHLVLGNRVVFGSVNANRRYFELGIRHLRMAARRWPGLLSRFFTRRLTPEAFREALARPPEDVKTVITFSGDGARR